MIDSSHSDQVMVALLPTSHNWCKQKLPHLTVVYCGYLVNLKPTDINELSKICLNVALANRMITLTTAGPDVFCLPDEPVDVIRMNPTPELLAIRSVFEPWCQSEHPFNPHVTVGPEGSIQYPLPDYITFDRIAVSWGEQIIQFNIM